MDKLKKKLNDLVIDGVIKDYSIDNVSEEGKIGERSEYRNTERIMIRFNSDDLLCIHTFCSGSSEDTILILEE